MPTKREIQRGNRRLLRLAATLDSIPRARFFKEFDGYRGYNQSVVLHPCGAPACAWGHYVIDTRRRARIIRENKNVSTGTYMETVFSKGRERSVEFPSIWGPAQKEFSINDEEAERLFEASGCGGATTGKQAARYIRAFVAQRQEALANE